MLQSDEVMSPLVLETFTRDYIASQSSDTVTFSWQGGEPAMAGLEFYQHAISLQKWYCPPGKYIRNKIITNGTLFNEQWFEFLNENRFIVGISLDGPPEINDIHRLPPSSDRILECIAGLKSWEIPFFTLTSIHDANSSKPLEVYHYLRDVVGSVEMRFSPVVEIKDFATIAPGYWEYRKLDIPEKLDDFVTDWSVRPLDYGKFMTEIFREWYKNDHGKIMIPFFEALLGEWTGSGTTLCTISESCGKILTLDRDGNLYCCDHFCYPEYQVGNILDTRLSVLAKNPKIIEFSKYKRGIPPECIKCSYYPLCRGGCPKNRFALTSSGNPGLNYLCPGMSYFFQQTAPTFEIIAQDMKEELWRVRKR